MAGNQYQARIKYVRAEQPEQQSEEKCKNICTKGWKTDVKEFSKEAGCVCKTSEEFEYDECKKNCSNGDCYKRPKEGGGMTDYQCYPNNSETPSNSETVPDLPAESNPVANLQKWANEYNDTCEKAQEAWENRRGELSGYSCGDIGDNNVATCTKDGDIPEFHFDKCIPTPPAEETKMEPEKSVKKQPKITKAYKTFDGKCMVEKDNGSTKEDSNSACNFMVAGMWKTDKKEGRAVCSIESKAGTEKGPYCWCQVNEKWSDKGVNLGTDDNCQDSCIEACMTTN